jgi:hypothetical protein
VIEMAKSEGQLGLDLMATLKGAVPQHEAEAIVIETTRGQVAAGVQVALPRSEAFNAANVRAQMARENGLAVCCGRREPAGDAPGRGRRTWKWLRVTRPTARRPDEPRHLLLPAACRDQALGCCQRGFEDRDALVQPSPTRKWCRSPRLSPMRLDGYRSLRTTTA